MKKRDTALGAFYMQYALELAEITLSVNNDFTQSEVRQFRDAFLVLLGKYDRIMGQDLSAGKNMMDKELTAAIGPVSSFDKRFRTKAVI